MRLPTILKVLGVLLMTFSLTMLPPLAISLWYNDHNIIPFLTAFILILSIGFTIWFPTRNQQKTFRTRDGFLIVVIFWTVLGVVGGLPFVLAKHPDISFTNAVFESISGLTATGATVLTGLDELPRSVLFYRQQLQFLGGMGIIILAVAILPMLGIGGMQLFRMETSGPLKNDKLTPRITESAKALWLIYVGLTAVCALSYWIGGMSGFDAISYSMSTVSTGGYAPHDASMGYFDSNVLKLISIVFMLLGALSFSLHFFALRRGRLRVYWHDPEVKMILAIITVFSVLMLPKLVGHIDMSSIDLVIDTVFQVVSFSTTTGYISNEFYNWPSYVPYLLILAGLIGGCSGSTSGGIKIIRFILLRLQVGRELKRLVHPSGYFIIKFAESPLSNELLDSVWAYMGAFTLLFVILTLVLIGTGLDTITAFSAVISALANLGPALGRVSMHFDELSDFAKWVLSFTMIIGRLEIFTVVVLFSRTFWRS